MRLGRQLSGPAHFRRPSGLILAEVKRKSPDVMAGTCAIPRSIGLKYAIRNKSIRRLAEIE